MPRKAEDRRRGKPGEVVPQCMSLKAYCIRYYGSVLKFEDTHGLGDGAVQKWTSGRSDPCWPVLCWLCVVTGGIVTPLSWRGEVDDPEGVAEIAEGAAHLPMVVARWMATGHVSDAFEAERNRR